MRKRRIKWRNFKCKARNFTLIAITVFAMMILGMSICLLAEAHLKALIAFLISAIWLVMFCKANRDIEII